ncbi:hypothetical protein HPB49_011164 [Dermacentor silvarum]|uniref:Uncharacterized protein n=1 Tax=Dermacentor silvarum TaxID=543639 RepID=A0ACB8C3A0_DERSI|nr:hypothetical protein HPB49_011164 [Dermacentor silvarum]
MEQSTSCVLYKKQYEACIVGHRCDVCPKPQSTRCRGCGCDDPPVDHQCEPRCRICGIDHQTGDRKCHAKYRTPYVVKKRQWERRRREEEEIAKDQIHYKEREDDFPVLEGQRRGRSTSRPAGNGDTNGQPRPSQVSSAEAASGACVRVGTATPSREGDNEIMMQRR